MALLIPGWLRQFLIVFIVQNSAVFKVEFKFWKGGVAQSLTSWEHASRARVRCFEIMLFFCQNLDFAYLHIFSPKRKSMRT